MKLNFKNNADIIAFVDAIIDANVNSYASDWYKYDRKKLENLEAGQWGYLCIREMGTFFDYSIRQHDEHVNCFDDVRFTAIIIREAEDLYAVEIFER